MSEHVKNEELLPCPFCSGKATLKGRFVGKKHYVSCDNCMVRTPYYPIKSYVISLWNSRTEKQ